MLAAGANPMSLKRGIDKAVDALVSSLVKLSKKIKTSEEIAQVGTISANGDETIGSIIAEVMEKLVKMELLLQEAKSIETSLDVVEGMQFDKGYLSPYFVTDANSWKQYLKIHIF